MKLIVVLLFAIFLLDFAYSIEFLFTSGQHQTYFGYLWINGTLAHVIPKIQVLVNHLETKSGLICGFQTHSKEYLPFNVQLIDKIYGFAEIRVYPHENVDFSGRSAYVFEMSAYDCDEPPHFSSRVLVHIQLINQHGPVFDKSSYSFKLGQISPVGSVVGQLKAIEEISHTTDILETAICNYRIDPPNNLFSIDKFGVLRVREPLPSLIPRPYSFHVVAEDCHRPVPLSTRVSVIIEKIMHDCQSGWKGLPTDIEYRGHLDKPERLFWPPTLHLDTCTGICVNSTIEARLQLQSVIPDKILYTANPQSCRHDPISLIRQNKLCNINALTVTDLLPNPEHDLATQLVGPALGNLPRAIAPTMVWRFDSSSLTTWEISADHIFNQTSNLLNPYDNEFTITFWLRRFVSELNSQENTEEMIICSHDEKEPDGRYLSISLQDCRLIIRIMTSITTITQLNGPQNSTLWVFDPLPENICSSATHGNGIWHHYAITFSRSPSPLSDQPINILIDGLDFSLRGIATEFQTRNSFSQKMKPRITIGSCFDPSTHLTRQHLNGELAGLNILHGQTESPGVLRCIAQCGETLFIPNLLQVLKSDIDISLQSDEIVVRGSDLDHVTQVLTHIAYIRPQPGISVDYTPNLAQSRLLKLTSSYNCLGDRPFIIPPTLIKLNILPISESDHSIETSHKLAQKSSSAWLPNQINLINSINKNEKYTISNPPSLIIFGSDIVSTEPPITAPGIPIFSDLRFGLPTEITTSEQSSSAGSVLIDDCLIWLISTGTATSLNIRPKLYEEYGARIDWPVDEVHNNEITGSADENGIHLRGRKPAQIYAKLLQKFRFWPPESIRTIQISGLNKHIPSQDIEVIYMANIGLICSLDGGKQNTPQFVVKVIVQGESVEIESLLADQPAHLVKSDQERRDLPTKEKLTELRPIGLVNTKKQMDIEKVESNSTGLIVGISVSVSLLIIMMIVAFLLLHKKLKESNNYTNGKRRRFTSQPADFGGENLKTDPTLRLTTNPLMDLNNCVINQTANLKNSFDNQLNHCIYSPPVVKSNHNTSNGNMINNFNSNIGQSNLICNPIYTARLADMEEFDDIEVDENFEYDDDDHIQDQQLYSTENKQKWGNLTESMNSNRNENYSNDKRIPNKHMIHKYHEENPCGNSYEWIDNLDREILEKDEICRTEPNQNSKKNEHPKSNSHVQPHFTSKQNMITESNHKVYPERITHI